MEDILACTDGSLYAPSIYRHSAWAANRLQVGVHVMHMLNPHHERPLKSDYSGSIGFGAKSALLEELVELEAANARIAQRRGQAILDDASAALREDGVERINAEQKHGKLSELIANYEKDAVLVVLGKRGNNADYERRHLGSNLERVIRSCSHPVLVAAREFREMRRFLIAFDGGKSARKAVDYIATSPLLTGMRAELLFAGEPKERQREALDTALKTLRDAGFDCEEHLVSGAPEAALAKAVETRSIDLLVMGAYGHSQVRQLFVGSTTSEMIRTVRQSVLLFR